MIDAAYPDGKRTSRMNRTALYLQRSGLIEIKEDGEDTIVWCITPKGQMALDQRTAFPPGNGMRKYRAK